MPRLFLSSDHRGFAEKQRLVGLLKNTNLGFDVIDLGPSTLQPDDDFNDAAIMMARSIRENRDSLGILICGSAQGVCIQANRFKGVRAIYGYDERITKQGREHDNANVLCLSADYTKTSDINKIVAVFVTTHFLPKERYIRRTRRLDEEEIYG
ncbi:RpiB/LacA/LacB family sugar-phosphate isomerase [Candidatus Saccharibacteria bacterium]|nr:RpiB/LacA/LacB family sugar-phosphate isomerase [Candidatus Saccharibacteria bacterium]